MNKNTLRRAACVAITLAAAGLASTAAQAQSTNWNTDQWKFSGTIYAYLPTIGGKTEFPPPAGGSSINVDADTILNNLKFTFMGTLDVHNGRWGAFTDVIYMDVGGSKSNTRDFSIGNTGIPAGTTADINLDIKALVWTVAGEYRIANDPAFTLDVLAGARLLNLKEKLGYSISGDIGPLPPLSRSGDAQVKQDLWDGIVGVKGRYAFGAEREWFLPFYGDVGTGQSDLTWQAAGGIGYAFKWGEVIAMWRYLDYDMKSGKKVQDLNLNGPMIGVTFHW